MSALIPVYKADGSLYAWASEQRFARLQSAGLVARVVCHRKGYINRATLFLRPGRLSGVGNIPGGKRREKTYAPPGT